MVFGVENLYYILYMEEIDEALSTMILVKIFRVDGLPIEFHKTRWPYIWEDFYYVYLEAIEMSSLWGIINEGLICCVIKLHPL